MKEKYKIILAIIGLLLLVSLSIYDLYINNFHTVIAKQVYRSSQLSTSQFKAVIKDYDIKSIINLRGANPDNTWYTDEIALSKQMNVNHYDVSLGSDSLPTPANFQKLVSILQTAPRPLLLHCESGVDRSGLAAAVSLILADNSLDAAKKQVSWKYFVFSNNSVGKQFLSIYEKWLADNQLTTSKDNFLRWLTLY